MFVVEKISIRPHQYLGKTSVLTDGGLGTHEHADSSLKQHFHSFRAKIDKQDRKGYTKG